MFVRIGDVGDISDLRPLRLGGDFPFATRRAGFSNIGAAEAVRQLDAQRG